MSDTISRREAIVAGAAGVAGVAAASLAAAPVLAGKPALAKESASADSASDLEARISELEDRLWVCEAKEAIRYKLCMYCRGDDRQDEDEGLKAFADDAYVDYGTSPDTGVIFQGSGPDWVRQCIENDKELTAGGSYYAHVIDNICITVNGNKAGSETYVTAPVMISNEDGTYTMMQSVARYCDKWECRDGDWLIVERHTTNDFGYYWASTGLYTPYDCTFDKNDPSYEALAYGE
jgi:hypothetical protein